MEEIKVFGYAKINLFLEVCEKRPDSYHNIDSVMQSVSLHDVITIKKCDSIKIDNNIGLPNDENNLAYKAAKRFFEYTNIHSGAEIYIEKNIPVSAGLAGGSTDAAAVLKGLNKLYTTNLSTDELCRIGSKLGADVPFCIKCGTYVTKGIGDIFTPCSSLCDCHIVISKMGEGVSTPFAYNEIDSSRIGVDYKYKSSEALVDALATSDLSQIARKAYNSFEQVVCPIRPMVEKQKLILTDNGAVLALMSGSGPSVFGLFDNEKAAQNALRALVDIGADAHICKPYNL